MKLEKSIEEQIRDLRQPADAETHNRILGELRGVLRQRGARQSSSQPMTGAMPASHQMVRVAAAAAVLAAMALLALFGDGVLHNRSAYAGVVKALQDVNSVHI